MRPLAAAGLLLALVGCGREAPPPPVPAEPAEPLALVTVPATELAGRYLQWGFISLEELLLEADGSYDWTAPSDLGPPLEDSGRWSLDGATLTLRPGPGGEDEILSVVAGPRSPVLVDRDLAEQDGTLRLCSSQRSCWFRTEDADLLPDW